VGAYIARENIAVGEALAYTRGQRVEADAVKANGWEDLVVGEGTKEARAIHADITGQPAEDDARTSVPAKPVAKQQEG
jgi:hypothetical protein